MKRFNHTVRSYKTIYFPLTAACLLFIVSVGFFGFSFLNGQYTQKLRLLANITGAVVSENPDMEDMLLGAIQDTDGQYLDDGFAILNRYGYRKSLSMYHDRQYQSVIEKFFSLLFLFCFLFLIIITVGLGLLCGNQSIQERRLLALLESYLSEDYSFLERDERTGIIFNKVFTDTLLKLGYKLMLKTQALSKERDNTKTLVTDISHQLKTPVSALKNCLSICMETDSPKEHEEFLQRCAQQLNKLEYLMEALINISRLETSMITLHREETALQDILIDAVNTVYIKAMHKDITIEVINTSEENGREPDSLTLPLDRKWTAEALANILDNAVKYSPAGSAVSVRCQKLHSYVRIEIEDAGIGIPQEEYNIIFKRFYRGPHPAVRHSEGAGVGLYLCRRIIEEQGGSITVKPAVSQGSIFVVKLPLYL